MSEDSEYLKGYKQAIEDIQEILYEESRWIENPDGEDHHVIDYEGVFERTNKMIKEINGV